MTLRILLALSLAGLVAACSQPEETTPQPEAQDAPVPIEAARLVEVNANRNAYFGDLHVHTRFSFDAFIFGTRHGPDEAYEFAKGGALQHPAGMEMKMKKPLDFQGVADHAVYLGMLPAMFDPATAASQHPIASAITGAETAAERSAAFQAIIPRIGGFTGEEDDLLDLDIVKSAWAEIIASADRHNDPGNFTAFIAYEYTTGGPAFENLHRNVVFRGDASAVPDIPFSRLDSLNPEDLWVWMDSIRAAGKEALAIPHNSNGSDGWMFEKNYYESDKPIDTVYADQRMRNEPLVEITQVKGTSDTHPLLSPNDEWADFEIMPYRIATQLESQPPGSYVRDAYLSGIAMAAASGFNPYRFGVIGSSDTHNAAGSFEEDNYWSKTGMLDATPQLRGSVPLDEPTADGESYAQPSSRFWGGSGLAGAWAESNTRGSIYDAFRRKETFGTSGPHIRVRFFGGYGIDQTLLAADDIIADAYSRGVPMGGDLLGDGDSVPSFFVWATRDADTAPLQRLQVVKGWVEDGETFEQVYDVACSDGGTVDPTTHRCPDNGATVDIATCAISQDKGAAELSTVWSDPSFVPGQRAFYYVRVLENPKCRWSTWDAIRAGVAPRPDMHATIQDRA